MRQVRNFILAEHASPWEISNVSSIDDLKGRALYDALMRLRPEGLAETDWAVKAGMNRGFFTSLKKAPTSPRIVTIRKLLRHVDKTESDLYAAASGQAVMPDREPDQLPTRSEGAGDTVSILRLDLSLPMGPGAVVDDYVEEEPLEFDQAYINSFTRTPAHRLRLAAGAGDSMFPTLVSNDLVWIDTTQNQLLHADRIYAASINGGAAIKRLRPIAGGRRILVVSDNKTVDAYEVDAEEVVIWGRVIRFARDL